MIFQTDSQEVSNYIISALAGRVAALIDGHALGSARADVDEDHYAGALLLLLEAAYFFYTVNPTVPSSLKIAQAVIQASEFFKKVFPERAAYLAEQVVRWTFQFIKSLRGVPDHRSNECVPLEAMNLLLVLGEVGRAEVVAQKAISEFCDDVSRLMYFEIVSYLFCIKDHAAYGSMRDELFERASVLILGKNRVRIDAHAAYLALDILACPYIDRTQRANLMNALRADIDLPKLTTAGAIVAVAEMETQPWFVEWQDANILSMIRKKELSAVY